DGVFARSEAIAVEESAVGTAQVAQAPALVGDANFGMASADGGIVEDNFERGESAGAQDCLGIPGLSFDVSVDATQANAQFQRAFLGASKFTPRSRFSRLQFSLFSVHG